MAAEQIDTIIGAHVEVKGSLRNQGSIQIHGTVSGDVTSGAAVIIGESAVVHGPITAKQVEVSGQVHGSITAEDQIELHPKSLVKGDLTTKRLSIRPGAVFIGQSNMSAEGISLPDEGGNKKRPRIEVE